MIELFIKRNLTTSDGTFGDVTVYKDAEQNVFTCKSVERTAVMIDTGVYNLELDMSPRLGYLCPHIQDDERDQAAGGDAGIRIHKFNEPEQSEGCIGVGTVEDGDAVDNSKTAFDELMAILQTDTYIILTIS
jgi:hypothetical protein